MIILSLRFSITIKTLQSCITYLRTNTFSISVQNTTQHNDTNAECCLAAIFIVELSVVMLNVIMMNDVATSDEHLLSNKSFRRKIKVSKKEIETSNNFRQTRF
jgi:hypothetical protein